MKYQIVIERKPLKNLHKIPENFAEKIRQIIYVELSENPHPPHPKIEKLNYPLNGYRYKVSPYRILYQIDENLKRIVIYKIKHRKDVYKRFGIF